MPDPDTPPATVLDRLLAAGLSEDRARQHLEQGAVRAGGEVLTDPVHPLPWPAAYVIGPQ